MIMDWRTWMYGKLTQDGPFTSVIQNGSVFAGGSMEDAPALKPFVILRFLPRVPALPEDAAHFQRAEVWCHDEPGSYLRIDQALSLAEAALVGPATGSGIYAEWEGQGTDLFDDGWKTITRYSSFKLTGSGR